MGNAGADKYDFTAKQIQKFQNGTLTHTDNTENGFKCKSVRCNRMQDILTMFNLKRLVDKNTQIKDCLLDFMILEEEKKHN